LLAAADPGGEICTWADAADATSTQAAATPNNLTMTLPPKCCFLVTHFIQSFFTRGILAQVPSHRDKFS
jgi:hypothetical protein